MVLIFQERLLHFAFLFIQLQPSPTLKDSWPRVLSLLRECVVLTVLMTLPTTSSSSRTIGITDKGRLTPRCYFLLLLIAAEFVKKIPSFDDKKDQKDLQVLHTNDFAGNFINAKYYIARKKHCEWPVFSLASFANIVEL